jgi:hypothetical protein
MNVTRRNVLTLGALSAASAAVPFNIFAGVAAPQAASSGPGKNEYENLSRMTAESFKPWVGSVFDVHPDSSGAALVILDEVQDPPAFSKSGKGSPAAKKTALQALSDSKMKAFALRFKSLSGEPLSQGTYVFENGALGRFALFVVPSGDGAEPMYYTALVNRLTQ